MTNYNYSFACNCKVFSLVRDQKAAGSNPATSTIETPCKPLICKEFSYFHYSLIIPRNTRLFLAMTNSVTITVTNVKRGPEGPLFT